MNAPGFLSIKRSYLSWHTQGQQDTLQPTIRDPYVFEFLGLKPREVMSESHLKAELLNHIEEFLLELGHGFCFEARQKRILIGDTHNFVDLVFYHRIFKCHVLVEYALAGMDHGLFVSKYQLELPGKEKMQKFIEEKLREAGMKDEL